MTSLIVLGARREKMLLATLLTAVHPLGTPFVTYFGDLTLRSIPPQPSADEQWSFEDLDGADTGGVAFTTTGGVARLIQYDMPSAEVRALVNALLCRRFEDLRTVHDHLDEIRRPLPPSASGGEEVVACCDAETGRDLVALPRSYVIGNKILLRGVGILVQNSDGHIYVHRRADDKRHFPSMYDMWVGGMAGAGEDAAECARREIGEELGLGLTAEPDSLRYCFSTRVRTQLNHVYVDCFEYLMADDEEVTCLLSMLGCPLRLGLLTREIVSRVCRCGTWTARLHGASTLAKKPLMQ